MEVAICQNQQGKASAAVAVNRSPPLIFTNPIVDFIKQVAYLFAKIVLRQNLGNMRLNI
jgi:hypothetical protein